MTSFNDAFFRDFTLVVEPTQYTSNFLPRVDCTAPALMDTFGNTKLVSTIPAEVQVPITKLRATLQSARARVQTRTLAQQLLDATHDADAAELFARIALTQASGGIISPSPTRATFPNFVSVIDMSSHFAKTGFATSFSYPAPVQKQRSASPASSRPSSRSSSYSGSESLSDIGSIASTAASSIASSAYLADLTAKRAAAAPLVRPSAPIPGFVPRTRAVHTSINGPKPKPAVIVDASKKDLTKYLYQGGVSTVLTGGVMLGAPASSPAKKAKQASTPKYRAPIYVRTKTGEANVASWRRKIVAHA